MWYKAFLEDKNRLSQLRKAMFEIVKPGDTVFDIGTGLGTLSFFACQAGAKKVYALDNASSIKIAEEIAQKNTEFSKRVIFVKKNSKKFETRNKADVIVSETLGTFGFGGGITRFMSDARNRLLKKDGIICPRQLILFLIPLYNKKIFNKVLFFKKKIYGIDFSPCINFSTDSIYDVYIKRNKFHTDWEKVQPCFIYNFAHNSNENVSFKCNFISDKSQTIYGFLGWYDFYLTDAIKLTNEPGTNFCWGGQSFFPLRTPVKISKNDHINIQIDGFFLSSKFYWSWKTEILDNRGEIKAKFSQNNIDEYYTKQLLQRNIN